LIPKSIIRSLARQDLSVLCEIRDHVERLISERRKPPLAEELPGEREVLEVRTSGSTTYRLERVSCGKNCKGCPHGPYWYGYWREGGKTRSKYVGKNLPSTETKKGVAV
jgi:hypothetical protein